MLSEPKTLYKLMNLYMLKQVNFPLTNSQLTDFFLQHEYTSYFALQQVLNELLEAGLIRVHTNHNMSRYEITKEGEDTLEFFGKNISPAIIDDMDQYLKENRFRIVHCEVREGKTVLLDLSISVPDRDQAESMCSQWEKKNQEIYAYVMKTLMSDS